MAAQGFTDLGESELPLASYQGTQHHSRWQTACKLAAVPHAMGAGTGKHALQKQGHEIHGQQHVHGCRRIQGPRILSTALFDALVLAQV